MAIRDHIWEVLFVATMYIKPFGHQILVRFLNVNKKEVANSEDLYAVSMIKDNLHYCI